VKRTRFGRDGDNDNIYYYAVDPLDIGCRFPDFSAGLAVLWTKKSEYSRC
jgi:hypothetical protein